MPKWWRNKQNTDIDRKLNQLAQELERIEKQHDSGQLNHDLYRLRQRELRQQIQDLQASATKPTES